MTAAFDYKKEYKDLYLPKANPMFIEVPEILFIAKDGSGDPNGPEYPRALEALYALSYTIKMSKMKQDSSIDGYFEYVIPPLEGLWWLSEEKEFSFINRSNWLWTSMIRQPDFVNQEVFSWACSEVARKKPRVDLSAVRLSAFTEGPCVQIMHLGPYETEPLSLELMHAFMDQNGYVDDTGNTRKHHEIYLNDPRKTPLEKLKTVIRHPVRAA